jgi:hypothetical protein
VNLHPDELLSVKVAQKVSEVGVHRLKAGVLCVCSHSTPVSRLKLEPEDFVYNISTMVRTRGYLQKIYSLQSIIIIFMVQA